MKIIDEHFLEINGRRLMRGTSRGSIQIVDAKDVPKIAVANRATAAEVYAVADMNNPDLAWAKFVLDTEGGNANWDYMPRPALTRHFGTAAYKPFNVEHVVAEDKSMVTMDRYNPTIKNTIFGVMTSSALCSVDGEPLSADSIKNLDMKDDPNRDQKDKIGVCAWAVMYPFLFPKTVADVIKSAEDGKMFVSMERWIAEWDFMVHDGTSYQAVSSTEAEKEGVFQKWARRTPVNGKAVYRRSLNFIYGGVASTSNPANKASKFIQHVTASDLEKVLASNLFSENSEKVVTVSADNLHIVTLSLCAAIDNGRSQIQEALSEMQTMANENTATSTVLTPDMQRAIAEELAKYNSAKDKDKYVTERIEALATDAATAKASLAKVSGELVTAQATITSLNTELATTKTNLTTANASIAEQAGKISGLTTELTGAQAKVKKIEVQAAIAARVTQIDKTELPDTLKTSMKAEASAVNAAGDLVKSEAEVTTMVTSYQSVYAAGRASAAGGAAGGAAGTPAATPPAGTQTPPAQASASTQTPPGTPAAPNLFGSEDMARAMAGALGMQPPSDDMVTKYATQFPMTLPVNHQKVN